MTHFQGKGFQKLNGKVASDLEVSLGREAVRAMVLEKARFQKEELKKQLAGAIVFLKFDAATRLRNNFLGINVQFFDKENGLTVKNLALMDMHARHDAEHTKDLVKETRKKFGIEKSNVLACVVDNATNMTKTVRLMNQDSTEVEEQDDEETEAEGNGIEGK